MKLKKNIKKLTKLKIIVKIWLEILFYHLSIMGNKEFLIKVLEAVGEDRELWHAILVLLKEDELDWDAIDKISKIMVESIDAVENKQVKEKILKGVKLLKAREKADNEKNEKAVKELEDMIDSI